MTINVQQIGGQGWTSLAGNLVSSPRSPVPTDITDVNGVTYQSGRQWQNTTNGNLYENLGPGLWVLVTTISGDITQLTTPDAAVIVPTAGNITFAQGSTFNITGAGSTATFDLRGTSGLVIIGTGTSAAFQGIGTNSALTAHGVLLGEGTGAFAATAAGAIGTLLVGLGASTDPAFATSAVGDFSFTASAANVVRTLTVSSTDNTGAATGAARLQLTVGGANVGNPQTTYTVTGATSWSSGIRNSNGDSYNISTSTSLGTNDAVVIDTTGVMTQPLQSAFLVHNTATANNQTGNGAVATVPFGTEIYDRNSDFAASTYTAPATGILSNKVSVSTGTVAVDMTTGKMILVASNRTILFWAMSPGAVKNLDNTVIANGAMDVDVDPADIVNIKIVYSGGAGDTASILGNDADPQATYWSGWFQG